MKAVKIIGMTVALALTAGPAAAFDVQQSGGSTKSTAPAPGIVVDNSPASQKAGVGIELRAPDEMKRGPSGTEVFIPGLGSLGVLPKMDFGLELLYGATDNAKTIERDDATAPSEDDIMIRGTVKHRF